MLTSVIRPITKYDVTDVGVNAFVILHPEHTHLQLNPLVEESPVVELTQQTGGSDTESGGGLLTPPTRHIAEEVIPEFSQ